MQQLNFTTYICLFTLHFLSAQENLFMMHEFVVPFSAFQELIYISLFEYSEKIVALASDDPAGLLLASVVN